MKKSFLLFPLLLIMLTIYSCRKKKLNEKLYEESTASDLVFYKGKDTIRSAKGGSPHGSFKLKFNSIAAAQLGADGKLPAGEKFKDGALIVKEIYSGSEVALYAVMKKDEPHKYSASGWLWAEYKPDGKTEVNITEQGTPCVSCHSTAPNRDLMRTFDLH